MARSMRAITSSASQGADARRQLIAGAETQGGHLFGQLLLAVLTLQAQQAAQHLAPFGEATGAASNTSGAGFHQLFATGVVQLTQMIPCGLVADPQQTCGRRQGPGAGNGIEQAQPLVQPALLIEPAGEGLKLLILFRHGLFPFCNL